MLPPILTVFPNNSVKKKNQNVNYKLYEKQFKSKCGVPSFREISSFDSFGKKLVRNYTFNLKSHRNCKGGMKSQKVHKKIGIIYKMRKSSKPNNSILAIIINHTIIYVIKYHIAIYRYT